VGVSLPPLLFERSQTGQPILPDDGQIGRFPKILSSRREDDEKALAMDFRNSEISLANRRKSVH